MILELALWETCIGSLALVGEGFFMQDHEDEDLGREILFCQKLKRKLRRCPRFVNSIIQTQKKT